MGWNYHNGMVVVCIFLFWGRISGSDHLKHRWGRIAELSRSTSTYGFEGGLMRRVYKYNSRRLKSALP